MAKKKIQCEVEEKGLDPTVPHSLLGDDNRLLVTPEIVMFQDMAESVELTTETKVDSVDSVFVVEEHLNNTTIVEKPPEPEPPVVATNPPKKGRNKQTPTRSE